MGTRTRIIEGTWECSSCGTKGILGRHKKCPTCNNPREEGAETKFDFGEADASGKLTREGVSDEKALDAAKLGPDWFCPFCAASNRDDAEKCKNCQAPRDRKEAKAAEVKPLTATAAASPAGAGSGGSGGSGGKMSLEEAARFVEQQKAEAAKSRRSWLRWGLGLGVLTIGTCFGTCLWAGMEHEVTGKVAGTEWTRTVEKQVFSPVTAQDWRQNLHVQPPRMPVNGAGEISGVTDIRNCISKQSGTKQVEDGQERVCHTKTKSVACGTEEHCTTVDKGNGFAEERCTDVTKYCNESYEECGYQTKYRTEPVYSDWCTYSTYKWVTADKDVANGNNSTPRWPEKLQAGEKERLARFEQYRVTVSYEQKGKPQSYTVKPTSEVEFAKWSPGSKVKVTANNLGDVTRVEPTK